MAHLESEFPRAILNFPLSLQNDLGRTTPHINELHDHSSSGSGGGEGGGWGQETRGVKRSSTRNSGRVSGFAPDENGAIVISRGTRKHENERFDRVAYGVVAWRSHGELFPLQWA